MKNVEFKQLQQHLFFAPTWLRGFFTLLFVAIYMLVRVLVFALMVFQFGSLLFSGKLNAQLLNFGESLSQYSYQVARYLTFNVETRPFPFDKQPWPLVKDKIEP